MKVPRTVASISQGLRDHHLGKTERSSATRSNPVINYHLCQFFTRQETATISAAKSYSYQKYILHKLHVGIQNTVQMFEVSKILEFEIQLLTFNICFPHFTVTLSASRNCTIRICISMLSEATRPPCVDVITSHFAALMASICCSSG